MDTGVIDTEIVSRAELEALPGLWNRPSGGDAWTAWRNSASLTPSGSTHANAQSLTENALLVTFAVSMALAGTLPTRRGKSEAHAIIAESTAAFTPTFGATVASAAEHIERIQTWLGLNTSLLAEILGVSRQTLYRWSEGTVLWPKEAGVSARLSLLGRWARYWEANSPTRLMPFLKIPIRDGRSVSDLFREEDWNEAEITAALNELSAVARERHSKAIQSAEPSSADADRQRLSATRMRIRGYRR